MSPLTKFTSRHLGYHPSSTDSRFNLFLALFLVITRPRFSIAAGGHIKSIHSVLLFITIVHRRAPRSSSFSARFEYAPTRAYAYYRYLRLEIASSQTVSPIPPLRRLIALPSASIHSCAVCTRSAQTLQEFSEVCRFASQSDLCYC